MALSIDDFEFHLPEALIAQTPAVPRDSSRLLMVDRAAAALDDYHFYDLPQLLRPGDVLVRNNTQVIPARLIGRKTTGGAVEVLLLKRVESGPKEELWECLTKPGVKLNQTILFTNELRATCRSVDGYTRVLAFNRSHIEFFEALYQIGQTPLPPYIQWSPEDETSLRETYQTIYASQAGSAAAPTAGLHFTPELDQQLREHGIQIEEVTLHVGLGTFLPVKETDITHHTMHQEWYELTPDVAARLSQAKAEGRRVIAVGTTSCRVLETCAVTSDSGGVSLKAGTGETDIFIYPPYRFQAVDGLITNFHLPKSTLLMLVSALVSEPNTTIPFSNFEQSLIGQAYLKAIADKYRFFSFGDAMLIV